jgi:hypothetical protein
LLSATKYADDVSLLVYKEIEKGYLIGPFIKPQFDIYRLSPIGIVEGKYSGKNDLFWTHTNKLHSSINDLINKEDYSLTYVKLNDAIKIVNSLGVKSSLSKCDVSDAIKNTPLNPETWHLFGFKFVDKYYFYTRLRFGCISPPTILIKYLWQFVGFCRIIII